MFFNPVRNFDVAIVGAGPAGSSLAIRLAVAGFSVLLVEQKKFPREKLCGEFISPECLTHFADLGIMPAISLAGGARLAETIFFARNGKGVAVRSEWFGTRDAMALGLSRAEMDQQLVDRVRELGVDVREETNATGLITAGDEILGIRIRDGAGAEAEIRAMLTVDATGRARSLARRIEPQLSSKQPAKFVAFKTHLRKADISAGTCEIYSYRGGYGGCNQVESNLYNLCFIASAEQTKSLDSDPERVMREVVFKNKRAAESMIRAEVAKPWLAVPIERFGRRELVPATGLLTVGDSAAFIDPFTGSGMLLALESAKIASSSIITHRDDLSRLAQSYKQAYSAAFDRRLQVCAMLRHAAFVPFLAEMTIALLGISVGLRRRIARATRFKAASCM